jgi:hypothetical protein
MSRHVERSMATHMSAKPDMVTAKNQNTKQSVEMTKTESRHASPSNNSGVVIESAQYRGVLYYVSRYIPLYDVSGLIECGGHCVVFEGKPLRLFRLPGPTEAPLDLASFETLAATLRRTL